MRRRITLAILISTVAIGIIAISHLFAGGSDYDGNRNGMIDNTEAVEGIQDYFDGDLSQEEAVDLFLCYFASVPMSGTTTATSKPTPRPSSRPTTTPAPTATPTPSPIFANFQLPCVNRTFGIVGGRYPAQKIVGRERAQDMEAVFSNPAEGEWQYGFESAWFESSGRYHGLRVSVNSNGNWLLYLYNYFQRGYIVWRGGNLSSHQIPFNYEAGEKNLVTLMTNIREKRFQLLVNGVEVPLDFEDREGENQGAEYTKISDHAFIAISQTRRQYIFGQTTEEKWSTLTSAHT